MIDNRTAYKLLLEKTSQVTKKINRLFLLLFIIPIIFFLVKYSFISELELPFVNVKQLDLILVLTPIIYSAIIFYIIILSGHINDLFTELENIESLGIGENSHFKKEWKTLLNPINLIIEVVGNTISGGFIGCIGVIFVFLPILLFSVIIPIIFLVYVSYFDLFLTNNFFLLSKIIVILSFWLILAAIIHLKSKSYSWKLKSENHS